MVDSRELAEYVGNLRSLLLQSELKFGLMVDRQVQVALLPKLSGTRGALEPHLWELWLMCLDGPTAPLVPLDQTAYDKAMAATQQGQALSAPEPARFPRAAVALSQCLSVLREHGVYPRPRGNR